MVGLQFDCLANPLGAVRSTFDKSIAAANAESPTFDGKDWGVVDVFNQFLFDQSNLCHVPVLSRSSVTRVAPYTLVRFQGMVQDMLGNELYVGAYKDGSTWKTNKFTDASQCPAMEPSQNMRIWERRLLYCVPVPGRSSWTEISSEEPIDQNCMDWTSPQREKRQRTDDNNADDELKDSVNNKKKREDMHDSAASQMDAKFEGSSSDVSTMTDPIEDTFGCLVKIYDSPESDLKLNDVFEFIGILTFDSPLPIEKDDNDELSDELLAHMPPNTVPRLHCIIHRKLSAHEFQQKAPTLVPNQHQLKGIRESLLGHLTAVLGNDGLTANFMLLHLLSKVHARADSVAVGKLSLNLTSLNKESISIFGTRLSQITQNLLPFTNILPLTIGYLNNCSLAPKKNYQLNRLTPGALQLPEGSHVIIDETKLEAGTLTSVGVENTRQLKNLLEFQKVEYDFEYYKMDVAADIQVLVLSEAKSHIAPADIIIPFQPSSTDFAPIVNEELIEAWRWYLATVRSLPYSIDSEMQKVVENDMVAARQEDRSLGSSELSRLLTLGRLISASFGESSLSLEHWQMVKELERLRRERLIK
ncbi:hypothetical protein ACFE04_030990 [Oxalis oulophora]